MKPPRSELLQSNNAWIDTQPKHEEATVCLNVYTQNGLCSKVSVVPNDVPSRSVKLFSSGDRLRGIIAFRLFFPQLRVTHVGTPSDLTHRRQ